MVVMLACDRRTGLARVTDDATMRDSLLTIVPPGTRVAVALDAMKLRGFTCTEHWDKSFGKRTLRDAVLCYQDIDVGVIRTL